MDKIRIRGQRPLTGTLLVSGAKNAVLPAMVASLLTDETISLDNVPDVWDVGTMRRLLAELGVAVELPSAREMRLTASRLTSHEAPYERVKTMRASVLTLGPLLARHGRARVSLPGGCAIGARPIDLHIRGLEQLGADIRIERGFVDARAAAGLRGANVRFETTTVTGTENLLMAACLAEGDTTLENCAREPEVVDLAHLLSKMGANIQGAGTDRIVVSGEARLSGASHTVIPDRIEAGTYLIAGALLGEDVEIADCCPEHLSALREALRDAGVGVEPGETSLHVRRARALRPLSVATAPHPGFPTDMQAQLMVLLTQAEGASTITESIFENRFMHAAELSRMGARIDLREHRATVHGKTPLSGAKVMATDLRASASLVLAALIAEGETLIDRVYHLDRGYQRIEEKLQLLGADIERLEG